MSDTMDDERALQAIADFHNAVIGSMFDGPAVSLSATKDIPAAMKHIAARLAQQPAAAMPEKILVPSIIEAARCLGSAQATKDTNAVTYWTAQIDHYAQAIAQRVVPEVTDKDVSAAWEILNVTTQPSDSCACDGDMRKVLESYRARLIAAAPSPEDQPK